ncbi:F0F1 ATP synthase subunit A [Roseibium aggregatum]|uniref:ATP synthase subunit a n=1 Tax=Roseibium aggregatum TaxID=187304 RepID=A0A926P1C5_9HYPH|nr:F0F1 ATP synthase subunit A [Roseibium aggregatum]MBD1547565.1 F0F1 ATP synthase subunit A [Roseibium aggregatum]
MSNDPIHQFQIQKIFPIEVGGMDFSFTNSSLFMGLTVAAASAFLIFSTSGRGLVPTRMQSVAEMAYEFVASMLRDAAGTDGMRFFPMVFSIFMFVLFGNLFGMFPYFFTITSHIIVTFALAMLVILTVVIYGFMRNGMKFLKLFVPSGVPGALIPLVTAIEIISFLSRPISLSVRLFANMLAGHITLKVFSGFVVSLGALGAAGVAGAVLPLGMTVALTALEFLVAFLQAYVFTVLTCMYLNDALHPSH